MSHKLQWPKPLKVSRKSVCWVRRYFAFYMLGECPIPIVPNHKTESILLCSDYDSPSHSAWSESSAACPRLRGGIRKGEKVGTWAFATLQKRGPQGRAHIWDVFVQQRQKRRMARPEGLSRCFGCGSFMEERGSSSKALVASDQKRQILALVVSS